MAVEMFIKIDGIDGAQPTASHTTISYGTPREVVTVRAPAVTTSRPPPPLSSTVHSGKKPFVLQPNRRQVGAFDPQLVGDAVQFRFLCRRDALVAPRHR